jgi:hypothetical protein
MTDWTLLLSLLPTGALPVGLSGTASSLKSFRFLACTQASDISASQRFLLERVQSQWLYGYNDS